MEKTINIAVLVDGDNSSAAHFEKILEEVLKEGRVTIKRVYGDWTSSAMKKWQEQLKEFSIKPIQNFPYTKGKNSTDIALIIDAMDILHRAEIQGFCIVSSDSDFTGLAARIKESGLFVMGIGRKQTPKSFINACDIFRYIEDFISEEEEDLKQKQQNSDKKSEKNNQSKKLEQKHILLLKKAVERKEKDNGYSLLSQVGEEVAKLDPTFSPSNFGYSNYGKMFRALDDIFEIFEHNDNTTLSVKIKV